MAEVSGKSQPKTPAQEISLFSANSKQMLDRISRRHKLDNKKRLGVLLCSLLFHLLLFLIVGISFSSLYRVDINFDEDAMQIVNLAKPVEKVAPEPPKPKPKPKPKQKSKPKLKPKRIYTKKAEVFEQVSRKQVMLQPDDVLAVEKVVISHKKEWEKQLQEEEEEVRREKEVDKKMEYRQIQDIEASPIIQKKLSYVDKLTNKMTITSPQIKGAEIFISINLPPGNLADKKQFELTGTIRPKIRRSFLTVNNDTRPLKLNSESFKTIVTLKKGVNSFTIMAMTRKGGVGTKSFKLLFSPNRLGPVITLISPKNGQQGYRAQQAIWVEGTVNDSTVGVATLFLNKIPIKIKVVNGRFKKKIFLPDQKINTFRVRAVGEEGIPGYSPEHTVLAGYDMGTDNPRPY